jgi:hypothetical protein
MSPAGTYRSRALRRNSSGGGGGTSRAGRSVTTCQPCSTARPEATFRNGIARYRFSSDSWIAAMPSCKTTQWSSPYPTFWGRSCGRALNRTGRRPTFNACSDARAARFAERVEANVATARISVPPAVAKEAIVLAFDIGGRLLLQCFVGRHAPRPRGRSSPFAGFHSPTSRSCWRDHRTPHRGGDDHAALSTYYPGMLQSTLVLARV